MFCFMSTLFFEGDFDVQCKDNIFPILKDYFVGLVKDEKVHFRKVNFVVIGSKQGVKPVGFWKKEYDRFIAKDEDVSGYVSVIGEYRKMDLFSYRKFLKIVRGLNPKLGNLHYLHIVVEVDPVHPLYLGKSALTVDVKSDKISDVNARSIAAFARRKDLSNDSVNILVEVDDPEGVLEGVAMEGVA